MKHDVIDFKQISEKGPQSLAGTYEVTAAELDRDEIAAGGSVSIEVTVSPAETPGEYAADGNVSFTADLSCSRCLEPYPFANRSSFHVTFKPRPEPTQENEEVEITEEEELDVEFYTDTAVPLRDLAVEQIQLSIPMKPLCDEDCLGLCPVCGVNRTRERCTCEAGPADERWGALRSIRDELAKKKEV
jgi:uncharacterized protein